MNKSESWKKKELARLMLLEHNGQFSNEDFEQLNKLLKENPHLSEYYVEWVIIYSGLIHCGDYIQNSFDFLTEQPSEVLDNAIIEKLLNYEKSAPEIKIQQESQIIEIEQPKRKINKTTLFAFATFAAMFLLVFLVFNILTMQKDLATVKDYYTDNTNADSNSYLTGKRLYNKNDYLLAKGQVLKLQMDKGALAIIEGPASFKVETDNSLILESGKIYAIVQPESIGFEVKMHNCSIVDLGTEFGAEVSETGDAGVYLYKGEAQLVVENSDSTRRYDLKQHKAMAVSDSQVIRNIAFKTEKFIRNFDSGRTSIWHGQNFSLADIVSGGNGWSEKPAELGIDQRTGKLKRADSEFANNERVPDYVKADLRYIDGVFVPDGGLGPTQLTSEGQTYDFPDTGGDYFIFIGPFSQLMMDYDGDPIKRVTPIHLKGFNKTPEVNMCVHANSGITFDLNEIRHDLPFAEVKSFSTYFGVCETEMGREKVLSDFYIFLDGKPVTIKTDVPNNVDPSYVNIPIDNSVRFLTLVCTEGEHNYGDWGLFTNPELVLESK